MNAKVYNIKYKSKLKRCSETHKHQEASAPQIQEEGSSARHHKVLAAEEVSSAHLKTQAAASAKLLQEASVLWEHLALSLRINHLLPSSATISQLLLAVTLQAGSSECLRTIPRVHSELLTNQALEHSAANKQLILVEALEHLDRMHRSQEALAIKEASEPLLQQDLAEEVLRAYSANRKEVEDFSDNLPLLALEDQV